MLVRDRMTPNPETVTPETTFDRALRLMRERRVRRFPVLDQQRRLVGIVSEKDLLNAAPSDATTLDRFEVHTLLMRMPISDVMTRPVITVGPDTPIEAAARLMADHKIGGLPVLEDTALAGIITETDLFRAMVDLLGARRPGLRLTLRMPNQRGALAQLAGEITRQGGTIVSVGLVEDDRHTLPMVVLKVDEVDRERTLASLRSRGATIIDVRQS